MKQLKVLQPNLVPDKKHRVVFNTEIQGIGEVTVEADVYWETDNVDVENMVVFKNGTDINESINFYDDAPTVWYKLNVAASQAHEEVMATYFNNYEGEE